MATIERGGRRWQILATKSRQSIDWRTMVDACAKADIVVSERWLPRGCTPRWLKLDRKMLGRTGGVAIYLARQPHVTTVADRVAEHPWAAIVPADDRKRMRYVPRQPTDRRRRYAPIRDRT